MQVIACWKLIIHRPHAAGKKESGIDPTFLFLHDILDGSIFLILPHSNSTLSSQTSLDLLLSSHVLFPFVVESMMAQNPVRLLFSLVVSTYLCH